MTPLPPAPNRSEEPGTFNTKADTFVAALPQMVTEANALQTDVSAKQLAAATSATTASTKAAEALASANAAVAAAPAYSSGTSYSFPQIVAYTDGQTYRAISTTSAGQSPASTPSKWVPITSGTKAEQSYVDDQLALKATIAAMNSGLALKFGNANDTWHKSGESADRALFVSNGLTNFRGYGATPFVFTNGSGVQVGAFMSDGRLKVSTDATQSDDATRLGQVSTLVDGLRSETMTLARLPEYTSGEEHFSCMIASSSDNRLFGWGRAGGWGTPNDISDTQAPPAVFCFDPPIPDGVSIAGHCQLSGTTTIAWLSNGWAYSGGRGDRGAQGQGDVLPRLEMKRVDYFLTNSHSITHVYGGGDRLDDSYVYAFWLTAAGQVYFTGFSQEGAAGDGLTTVRSIMTPVRCGAITGIVGMSVSAGRSPSIHAWKADGTCYAWGWQGQGQLGIGSTAIQYSPQIVTGLSVKQVSSYSSYNTVPNLYGGTLFLLTDGTVKFAGYGALGQGGPNAVAASTSTPVVVSGLSAIESLGYAGGDYGFCWAINTSKNLYTWGHNAWGQLGQGTTSNNATPTTPVGYSTRSGGTVTTGTPPFQGKVKKVVTTKSCAGGWGASAMLVLDTDGRIWIAGYDYFLCVDPASYSALNRFTQARVCQLPDGDKIVDIMIHGHAGSGYNAFALTQKGRLIGSGFNGWGVLTASEVHLSSSLVRGFNLVCLPGAKI
jgi:hypothetical protein